MLLEMQTRYFHLTDFKRRENGFQVNPHLNRKDETSKVRNIRYIIIDNLCLLQHKNGTQLKYVYH